MQSPSGLIPLVAGEGGDPWNHVEAAIALDISGMHTAATRAYQWLVSSQAEDGSWLASYGASGIEEANHVDTNTVGYLGTGLLVHALTCPDDGAMDPLFDCLSRALGFVLRYEAGSGAVPWSVGHEGIPAPFSLRAASSSLVASLSHAALLASLLGRDGGRWAEASLRIAHGVRENEHPFADKHAFAMDWYYPFLTGVIKGADAAEQFLAGAESFVTADGVLCRSDERWVTTAETAEASIAAARVGEVDLAERLFATIRDKRTDDGGYLTGLVYPERSEFPAGEKSSYSSAAVIIAADALSGGVMSEVFPTVADVARAKRMISTR